jgi:hypothetical protein
MNPAGRKLSRKERILRQIRGLEIDQIPSLGGWIGGARQLAEIAGISINQYLSDPYRGMIRAHLNLDVDGMIQPLYHTSTDQVRSGHVQESDFSGVEPEAIKEYAKSLPDTKREVLATFDTGAEEQRYRDYFERAFQDWEGIEPVPNFWEIGGHFPLYSQFGYTAFWIACAEYPEEVEKIWWVRSLQSCERSKILAKLYRKYDLVPLMFCGEDLCNNSGPMISPRFLRQRYLPLVQMIIEPLVNEGVRLIHHCDGDVRPMLQDYLKIGFSGLQGFQYELGIDINDLKKLRGPAGETLLFFTGLSVSRTLPFGNIEDICAEVDYFIDATDGGKGMFLFTSNVTGVEVPTQNLIAAYRHVKKWNPAHPSQISHHPWHDVMTSR